MISNNTDHLTYPHLVCKWCGKETVLYYTDMVIAKLQRQQACHECGFWLDRIAEDRGTKSDRYVVTQGFHHYVVADEDANSIFRGFGGQPWLVEWFDDRDPTYTTNLWHQGEIPERFRESLTPNARLSETRRT